MTGMSGTRRFTDDGGWQEQAAIAAPCAGATSSRSAGPPPPARTERPCTAVIQAPRRGCACSRIERRIAALGGAWTTSCRLSCTSRRAPAGKTPQRPPRVCSALVRPANTMLYVDGLIGDGFLVEIQAQAVVAIVRFSVRVNNDLSFAELLALAVAAESAGFDQVWVSNDLFLRSAPVLAGCARRPHLPDRPGHRGHEPVLGARQRAGNGRRHAAGGQRRPVPARARRRRGAVPRLGRDRTRAAAGHDHRCADRVARAARPR